MIPTRRSRRPCALRSRPASLHPRPGSLVMEPEPNRRRKFALGTLLAVLVVGMLEGFSVMAIRLTQRVLDEPIRRTAGIFAEQSDKIRRLLDPNRNDLLALDSSLGWRYRADYRSNDNVTNS